MSEKYGARKFRKEAYELSDQYAKDLFIGFITSQGHVVERDEENYNHDLTTIKDNKRFYWELETKSRYPFIDEKSFPFSSVSFLGRKERLHKIKPFFYVIICRETEVAVMCHSDEIFKEEYKQNLNIETASRKGRDQMYRVPKGLCTFFNINITENK